MDIKLTLKLDEKIIDKAKSYASSKKLSLSRLVENYFNSLTSTESNQDDIEISSFVKSISNKIAIPLDYDYKSDYRDHLDEKYK